MIATPEDKLKEGRDHKKSKVSTFINKRKQRKEK